MPASVGTTVGRAATFVPDANCEIFAECDGPELRFTHDEPEGCSREWCGARATIIDRSFRACR